MGDKTDHCRDRVDADEEGEQKSAARASVSDERSSRSEDVDTNYEHAFPAKLHYLLEMLAAEGNAHICGFQDHGRAFVVRDKRRFIADFLPKWFRQHQWASFQRQLNHYEFKRITSGPDRGSYYHPFFLKGRRDLCRYINRVKVKGKGPRKPNRREAEPNFYEDPLPSYFYESQAEASVATAAPVIDDHSARAVIPLAMSIGGQGSVGQVYRASNLPASLATGLELQALAPDVRRVGLAQVPHRHTSLSDSLHQMRFPSYYQQPRHVNQLPAVETGAQLLTDPTVRWLPDVHAAGGILFQPAPTFNAPVQSTIIPQGREAALTTNHLVELNTLDLARRLSWGSTNNMSAPPVFARYAMGNPLLGSHPLTHSQTQAYGLGTLPQLYTPSTLQPSTSQGILLQLLAEQASSEAVSELTGLRRDQA